MKEHHVNPLLIILHRPCWSSPVLGLIVFILLHSGKGTGISDMIASSVYSTQTGTSIVEKNLDRITIIFAVVFLLSLIVLMIIYPSRHDRRPLARRVGANCAGRSWQVRKVSERLNILPTIAWRCW